MKYYTIQIVDRTRMRNSNKRNGEFDFLKDVGEYYSSLTGKGFHIENGLVRIQDEQEPRDVLTKVAQQFGYGIQIQETDKDYNKWKPYNVRYSPAGSDHGFLSVSEVSDIESYARKYVSQTSRAAGLHLLTPVQFVDNSTKFAAYWNPQREEISINKSAFRGKAGKHDAKNLRNAIVHEYAHARNPNDNTHGEAFQRQAETLQRVRAFGDLGMIQTKQHANVNGGLDNYAGDPHPRRIRQRYFDPDDDADTDMEEGASVKYNFNSPATVYTSSGRPAVVPQPPPPAPVPQPTRPVGNVDDDMPIGELLKKRREQQAMIDDDMPISSLLGKRKTDQ